MKHTDAEFDEVSSNYDELLSKGLSLSGESSDYFAQKRVHHSAKLLTSFNKMPDKIIDYGCGTGGGIKYLLESFNPKKLTAADTSLTSLQILRERHTSLKIDLLEVPKKSDHLFDLCFCNGVFHHILPADRKESANYIFESLARGGFLCFWENNPWNPATHWVMSRISFDRDAVKIFPHQAVKLLQKVGFEIKLVHYMFIFPRLLKIFRPIEKLALRLPFGCQYLVLAQKN